MESADDNPQPPMAQQQMTDIDEPTVNDVLCGRGVTTNKWAGNEQFRSLVGSNKELYVTSTKRQKMAISRSIVDAVRSMNPPGRFLEKSLDTGLWNDIGNRKAIEKTSQALRDGAATLRKQLSADLGDPEFLSAVFDMESAAAAAKAASNASLPAKEKEKAKISAIKAKTNLKKGLRRVMSSPDVASSLKEKSALKRVLKRMDTPNSPSEVPHPVRGVHSNPTSPREGRTTNNSSYRGPYPSQFPPLQVEFNGSRGFFECFSEYPMCGSNYRAYDAGYEEYEGRPPYSPTVPWYPPPSAPMAYSNQPPPGPRAYPPLPHPGRKVRTPPSSGNYEAYWRHPYSQNSMPASPAGSVRSGGTVRSSPAALQDYDRQRHPYPPHYHHHPPPPPHHHYYHRGHPVGPRGSLSPLSNPPASPGDFTPPISPHSDRIPKREETVLTARPQKTEPCNVRPSKSPDDVVSNFPEDSAEADESFGFEVVLRDEAAKDSTPMRDDFKRGHLYYSYTSEDKDDDPAQISHEEDQSASPFHYDHDDDMDYPASSSFMMDISDDLLLEPIAPVGPMDEAHAVSRASFEHERASQ